MRSTVLFDADCGFCTRAAGLLRRLPLEVDVVALQSADLAKLGVDADRALAEMPYVDQDGSVVYGHAAVAAALRTGPRPLRIVGRLLVAPGIGRVAATTYRWIARHRQRLPGGTAACALPASQSSADK